MTDNESGCYARKLLFYYGPDVNLILLFRQSVPKGVRKIISLYFRQGKNWSWFLAFPNVASVVIHSIIVHPSDYILQNNPISMHHIISNLWRHWLWFNSPHLHDQRVLRGNKGTFFLMIHFWSGAMANPHCFSIDSINIVHNTSPFLDFLQLNRIWIHFGVHEETCNASQFFWDRRKIKIFSDKLMNGKVNNAYISWMCSRILLYCTGLRATYDMLHLKTKCCLRPVFITKENVYGEIYMGKTIQQLATG